MITVTVPLGDRSYDVLVGPGVRRSLAAVLPPGAAQVAVVTQEGIDVKLDPGVPSRRFVLPPGETAKTMASVESLCRSFARAGLSRDDAVVALGGGVVSDVAGFASACYLRGVSYVNVPTTLLAQVDAAIGGKTAVNLPEGKNLVGAFWQPAAVLCDIEVLGSLPARQLASGYGEVAKCAFLSLDPGSTGPGEALADKGLEEQVSWCVSLKAAVVSADEREGGRRMLLNYGHTLAHALEALGLAGGPVDLLHGEAVAVGLVFAAELAQRLGRIDQARVAEHRRLVERFGLPTEIPAGLSAAELVRYMARDKKARHDLTFVLDGPQGVEVVRNLSSADVVDTLESMGCAP